MRRLVRLALLAWLGLLAPCGLVRAQTGAVTAPEPDAADPDSLESAVALAELQAADVPLTVADLAALGWTPEEERPPSPRGDQSWAGRIANRLDRRADGWLVNTLRADAEMGSLQLRVRLRRELGAPTERPPAPAGGVSTSGPGRWAAAGGIGLQQGLGLLCGAPAARGGLTAAGRLGATREGWRIHSGTAEAAALWGGAAGARLGGVEVALAAGIPQEWPAGEQAPVVRLARITAGSGALGNGGRSSGRIPDGRDRIPCRLSLMAGQWCEGRGASGAVAAAAGEASLVAEAAIWRDEPHLATQAAWGTELHWHLARWSLDGQAAAARGAGPPLGHLPASLPGWDGSGWAARLDGPISPAARVRLLLADGWQQKEYAAGPRRRQRSRWEVGLDLRPRSGVSGDLAVSATDRVDWGWDERSPWLPAATLGDERKVQAAGTLVVEGGAWRCRLGARTLSLLDRPGEGETIPTGARRSLLSLGADWRGRRGWLVRLQWTTAWGDPIDLVGVATPLPGVTLPRHYGSWAGESGLGICREARRWSVRLGTCRRTPAAGGGRAVSEAWTTADLRW